MTCSNDTDSRSLHSLAANFITQLVLSNIRTCPHIQYAVARPGSSTAFYSSVLSVIVTTGRGGGHARFRQ